MKSRMSLKKQTAKMPFSFLMTCGLILCLPFFASAQDPYKAIAKELSQHASRLTTPKVAVVPFSYVDGRESPGGVIVSERIITYLVNLGQLEVVERAQLEKVLKELNLQLSGAIDPETTRELGKILGVEAIISGSLIAKRYGRVEINARLISTQTARVIAASIKDVEIDWEVEGEEPAKKYAPEYAPSPAPPSVVPYQPPSPVVPQPAFLDLFAAHSLTMMNLEFSRSTGMNKSDIGIWGGFSDGFKSIKWEDLKITQVVPPVGLRIGVLSPDNLGFFLDFFYSSHTIAAQTTTFWVDGAKQGNFTFATDDYFKVKMLSMSLGLLPHFSLGGKNNLYVGLGINLNLNLWEAPYAKGYTTSKTYSAPSKDTDLGFGVCVPIGVHIYFTDVLGFVVEGKYTYNFFRFNRSIKYENDLLVLSGWQALAGLSLWVQ